MPVRFRNSHICCISVFWGGIALAAIVFPWSPDSHSERGAMDPQALATVVNAAPSEKPQPSPESKQEEQQQEILGLRQQIRQLETQLTALRRHSQVTAR